MLDAVRGGGVCPDAADHAAAQSHRLPVDLLPGHVQLGHQPPHLRVEERWLPCRIR